MPHVLQQVRAAAIGALGGLATTGARVYAQERYPWQPDEVPGLVVSTASDPVREHLDTPIVLRWDVQLTVACVTQGTGDLAAQLDQIAIEVQGALDALATIGGKTVEVVLQSVEGPIFSVDGEQPVARRTLSFIVQSLYTLASAPDTLLD